MQTIPRPGYLDRLMLWRDKKLIKVISGVRRCGKSTLLTMFAQHLAADGVNPDRIISINFDDLRWHHLTDYQQLHQYVIDHLSDDATTYVFLDEVQAVPNFERAVESLYLRDHIDIYLTGSNAYFMSSELTTLLTGRYVEIAMLPLSFGEFCQATRADVTSTAALSEAYRRYTTLGSFPYALSLADAPQAWQDYLQSIFNSILLKDVVARHRISDVTMLQDVTRFVLDNVGNVLSPTRIANTLTAGGRTCNQRTAEKYLAALTQSLLFYEAQRFDVKGKRLLTRLQKYYAVDLGLRYVLLGGRSLDVGRVLENVVFLELSRRGYQVFVGQLGQHEIDFVATRQNERIYVQVAASVRDAAVLRREVGPLQAVPDAYPKILLTLDDDPDADYQGVRRTNALTWLLGD